MRVLQWLPILLVIAATEPLDDIPLLLDPRTQPLCNVSEFGASGNGRSLETEAIQSAIDSCASAGRRILFFPLGQYLTGTIFLKSNMIMYLEPGATILGSSRQADYPLDRDRWYVVLAANAEHVGITGGGSIDGQGLEFVTKFNERKNQMVSWNTTGACVGVECRPRLLGFVNCRNVRVWNVRLKQPAYWGLHIAGSDTVTVQDVTISGDFNSPNNDGIDIDGSNNTRVSGCHIDTADDGIVAKSIAGPVFNLSVTRSWIRSKSCALKVGSETYHDMTSLRFQDITVVDSHRGLGIQLRDAGHISDVVFSGIVLSTRYYDPSWWGRAEPMYVTACPRNTSTRLGSIKNVSFLDIRATSENGIFLAGSAGENLSNISFVNVQLLLARTSAFPGGLHDYRPGCQGLVPGRTSGIFMEHLLEATFQDVSLSWRTSNWDLPLDFAPRTVGNISLFGFKSSIYK